MNNHATPTRLRAWRLNAGLTTSKAAALLGFSRALYGPIELGRLQPSEAIQARIERAFGEPLADVTKPVPQAVFALPALRTQIEAVSA